MSKPRPPRRATIDGAEVVILPVADYEALATARRQLGAREARLRMMTSQVRTLTALVTDIQRLLADAPSCCAARNDLAGRIAELVDSRRPPARPAPPPAATP